MDQASRGTLLVIIAEQQGVISELRQRVESLEARLSGDGSGARMPGHKPAARGKKRAGEAKRPLRKRRQGFARLRMEPTAQVTHAPEFCSECHTVLSGGWVQRTREVIELPVSPAEVTEHVFIARRCPLCRKRRLPRDPLREVAVGRQRLGINLVSLVAALREEGRLPIRTIQWYLRTVHQLKLSVGAIVRVVHQVSQQARPAVAEALERIRSSPVVHADETGWRENGVNGYVWTFSTSTERYFLRRGRDGEVVDEALVSRAATKCTEWCMHCYLRIGSSQALPREAPRRRPGHHRWPGSTSRCESRNAPSGARSSPSVQHDQREPGQEAGRLGAFIIEFEPCQGVRCPKTAPAPAWRPTPQ